MIKRYIEEIRNYGKENLQKYKTIKLIKKILFYTLYILFLILFVSFIITYIIVYNKNIMG